MDWYEADTRPLFDTLTTLPHATDRVVFYGSSSIRMWTTLANDFPELNTLNLGFGGSTLAACSWFFEKLLVPAAPTSVVLYAGDNDLGDGRQPEEVFLFMYAFLAKMEQYLPGVPLVFLSIKLSPLRWSIADKIRVTDKLIQAELEKRPTCRYVDMTTPLLDADGQPRRDLFQPDGLHLNPAGYSIWRQALQQAAVF